MKKEPPRHLYFPTDEVTSARMGRVRQRDTKPEIELRGALHRLGVRFRVSNRDLPGSPDIANRRWKWAIFVHGCFWHGHEGCALSRLPRRNAEAWAAKIEDNRARDRRKEAALQAMGFRVRVIWACEIERLAGEIPAGLATHVRPRAVPTGAG